MKLIKFSEEKNVWLKKTRGVDFYEIIRAIKRGKILKILTHPNKQKYPKQKFFLVKLKKYIFFVPFVVENDYIFLKTIYPSRKYTKKLLKVK